MIAILKRSEQQLNPKETIGELFVYDTDEFEKVFEGNLVYQCKTLELPWKGNKRQESCIKKGIYDVIRRKSTKYGDHFHVTNVEGREMILIHALNFYTQTLGCIGVGDSFGDINKDGYTDILNSRKALDDLYKLLQSFKLKIQ